MGKEINKDNFIHYGGKIYTAAEWAAEKHFVNMDIFRETQRYKDNADLINFSKSVIGQSQQRDINPNDLAEILAQQYVERKIDLQANENYLDYSLGAFIGDVDKGKVIEALNQFEPSPSKKPQNEIKSSPSSGANQYNTTAPSESTSIPTILQTPQGSQEIKGGNKGYSDGKTDLFKSTDYFQRDALFHPLPIVKDIKDKNGKVIGFTQDLGFGPAHPDKFDWGFLGRLFSTDYDEKFWTARAFLKAMYDYTDEQLNKFTDTDLQTSYKTAYDLYYKSGTETREKIASKFSSLYMNDAFIANNQYVFKNNKLVETEDRTDARTLAGTFANGFENTIFFTSLPRYFVTDEARADVRNQFISFDTNLAKTIAQYKGLYDEKGKNTLEQFKFNDRSWLSNVALLAMSTLPATAEFMGMGSLGKGVYLKLGKWAETANATKFSKAVGLLTKPSMELAKYSEFSKNSLFSKAFWTDAKKRAWYGYLEGSATITPFSMGKAVLGGNIKDGLDFTQELISPGFELLSENFFLFPALSQISKKTMEKFTQNVIVNSLFLEPAEEEITNTIDDIFTALRSGELGTQSIIGQVANEDLNLQMQASIVLTSLFLGGATAGAVKLQKQNLVKQFGPGIEKVLKNLEKEGVQNKLNLHIIKNIFKGISAEDAYAFDQVNSEGLVAFQALQLGQEIVKNNPQALDSVSGELNTFGKLVALGLDQMSKGDNFEVDYPTIVVENLKNNLETFSIKFKEEVIKTKKEDEQSLGYGLTSYFRENSNFGMSQEQADNLIDEIALHSVFNEGNLFGENGLQSILSNFDIYTAKVIQKYVTNWGDSKIAGIEGKFATEIDRLKEQKNSIEKSTIEDLNSHVLDEIHLAPIKIGNNNTTIKLALEEHFNDSDMYDVLMDIRDGNLDAIQLLISKIKKSSKTSTQKKAGNAIIESLNKSIYRDKKEFKNDKQKQLKKISNEIRDLQDGLNEVVQTKTVYKNPELNQKRATELSNHAFQKTYLEIAKKAAEEPLKPEESNILYERLSKELGIPTENGKLFFPRYRSVVYKYRLLEAFIYKYAKMEENDQVNLPANVRNLLRQAIAIYSGMKPLVEGNKYDEVEMINLIKEINSKFVLHWNNIELKDDMLVQRAIGYGTALSEQLTMKVEDLPTILDMTAEQIFDFFKNNSALILMYFEYMSYYAKVTQDEDIIEKLSTTIANVNREVVVKEEEVVENPDQEQVKEDKLEEEESPNFLSKTLSKIKERFSKKEEDEFQELTEDFVPKKRTQEDIPEEKKLSTYTGKLTARLMIDGKEYQVIGHTVGNDPNVKDLLLVDHGLTLPNIDWIFEYKGLPKDLSELWDSIKPLYKKFLLHNVTNEELNKLQDILKGLAPVYHDSIRDMMVNVASYAQLEFLDKEIPFTTNGYRYRNGKLSEIKNIGIVPTNKQFAQLLVSTGLLEGSIDLNVYKDEQFQEAIDSFRDLYEKRKLPKIDTPDIETPVKTPSEAPTEPVVAQTPQEPTQVSTEANKEDLKQKLKDYIIKIVEKGDTLVFEELQDVLSLDPNDDTTVKEIYDLIEEDIFSGRSEAFIERYKRVFRKVIEKKPSKKSREEYNKAVGLTWEVQNKSAKENSERVDILIKSRQNDEKKRLGLEKLKSRIQEVIENIPFHQLQIVSQTELYKSLTNTLDKINNFLGSVAKTEEKKIVEEILFDLPQNDRMLLEKRNNNSYYKAVFYEGQDTGELTIENKNVTSTALDNVLNAFSFDFFNVDNFLPANNEPVSGITVIKPAKIIREGDNVRVIEKGLIKYDNGRSSKDDKQTTVSKQLKKPSSLKQFDFTEIDGIAENLQGIENDDHIEIWGLAVNPTSQLSSIGRLKNLFENYYTNKPIQDYTVLAPAIVRANKVIKKGVIQYTFIDNSTNEKDAKEALAKYYKEIETPSISPTEPQGGTITEETTESAPEEEIVSLKQDVTSPIEEMEAFEFKPKKVKSNEQSERLLDLYFQIEERFYQIGVDSDTMINIINPIMAILREEQQSNTPANYASLVKEKTFSYKELKSVRVLFYMLAKVDVPMSILNNVRGIYLAMLSRLENPNVRVLHHQKFGTTEHSVNIFLSPDSAITDSELKEACHRGFDKKIEKGNTTQSQRDAFYHWWLITYWENIDQTSGEPYFSIPTTYRHELTKPKEKELVSLLRMTNNLLSEIVGAADAELIIEGYRKRAVGALYDYLKKGLSQTKIDLIRSFVLDLYEFTQDPFFAMVYNLVLYRNDSYKDKFDDYAKLFGLTDINFSEINDFTLTKEEWVKRFYDFYQPDPQDPERRRRGYYSPKTRTVNIFDNIGMTVLHETLHAYTLQFPQAIKATYEEAKKYLDTAEIYEPEEFIVELYSNKDLITILYLKKVDKRVKGNTANNALDHILNFLVEEIFKEENVNPDIKDRLLGLLHETFKAKIETEGNIDIAQPEPPEEEIPAEQVKKISKIRKEKDFDQVIISNASKIGDSTEGEFDLKLGTAFPDPGLTSEKIDAFIDEVNTSGNHNFNILNYEDDFANEVTIEVNQINELAKQVADVLSLQNYKYPYEIFKNMSYEDFYDLFFENERKSELYNTLARQLQSYIQNKVDRNRVYDRTKAEVIDTLIKDIYIKVSSKEYHSILELTIKESDDPKVIDYYASMDKEPINIELDYMGDRKSDSTGKLVTAMMPIMQATTTLKKDMEALITQFFTNHQLDAMRQLSATFKGIKVQFITSFLGESFERVSHPFFTKRTDSITGAHSFTSKALKLSLLSGIKGLIFPLKFGDKSHFPLFKLIFDNKAVEEIRDNFGERKFTEVNGYSLGEMVSTGKTFIYGETLKGSNDLEHASIIEEGKKEKYDIKVAAIPLKKKAGDGKESHFTDEEFEQNKKLFDDAFAKLASAKHVVISKNIITSEMKKYAPKTFRYFYKKVQDLKKIKTEAQLPGNMLNPYRLLYSGFIVPMYKIYREIGINQLIKSGMVKKKTRKQAEAIIEAKIKGANQRIEKLTKKQNKDKKDTNEIKKLTALVEHLQTENPVELLFQDDLNGYFFSDETFFNKNFEGEDDQLVPHFENSHFITSLVFRILMEELKLGNTIENLNVDNFKTMLYDRNMIDLMKRSHAVAEQKKNQITPKEIERFKNENWFKAFDNLPVEPYQLMTEGRYDIESQQPDVDGEIMPPIAYDKTTGKAYFKVAFVNTKLLEEMDEGTRQEVIDLYYNDLGQFRYDGQSLILREQMDTFYAYTNGVLHEAAAKTFGVWKNAYIKHSVQSIGSESRIGKFMRAHNIAQLVFDESEKNKVLLMNESQGLLKDKDGNVIPYSEQPIGFLANSVALLTHTEPLGGYQSGVRTYYVPFDDYHRISEKFSRKGKTKALQQILNASGLTGINKAVEKELVDLFSDYTKTFANDVNEYFEDHEKFGNYKIIKLFVDYIYQQAKKPPTYLIATIGDVLPEFTGIYEKEISGWLFMNEALDQEAKDAHLESVYKDLFEFLKLFNFMNLLRETSQNFMNDVINSAVKYEDSGKTLTLMANPSYNEDPEIIDEVKDSWRLNYFATKYSGELELDENETQYSLYKNYRKFANAKGNAEKVKQFEEEFEQEWSKQKNLIFNSKGYLNRDYIFIDQTTADTLNLKVGDKVVTTIIPSAGMMEAKGVTIGGILSSGYVSPGMIMMNAEYIQGIGRDFDIDVINLVRPSESRMARESWNKVVDYLMQTEKNYIREVAKLFESMGIDVQATKDNYIKMFGKERYDSLSDIDKKMLLYFNDDAYTQYQIKFYGKANKAKKFYAVAEITNFKLSDIFQKDVGYVIVARSIHQYLASIGAKGNIAGFSFDFTDKEMWWKNHVAHMILTQHQVDYPKTVSKDFYNHEREDLYRKMIFGDQEVPVQIVKKAVKIFTSITPALRIPDYKGDEIKEADTDKIIGKDPTTSVPVYKQKRVELTKYQNFIRKIDTFHQSTLILEEGIKSIGGTIQFASKEKSPYNKFVTTLDDESLVEVKEFTDYNRKEIYIYNKYAESYILGEFLSQQNALGFKVFDSSDMNFIRTGLRQALRWMIKYDYENNKFVPDTSFDDEVNARQQIIIFDSDRAKDISVKGKDRMVPLKEMKKSGNTYAMTDMQSFNKKEGRFVKQWTPNDPNGLAVFNGTSPDVSRGLRQAVYRGWQESFARMVNKNLPKLQEQGLIPKEKGEIIFEMALRYGIPQELAFVLKNYGMLKIPKKRMLNGIDENTDPIEALKQYEENVFKKTLVSEWLGHLSLDNVRGNTQIFIRQNTPVKNDIFYATLYGVDSTSWLKAIPNRQIAIDWYMLDMGYITWNDVFVNGFLEGMYMYMAAPGSWQLGRKHTALQMSATPEVTEQIKKVLAVITFCNAFITGKTVFTRTKLQHDVDSDLRIKLDEYHFGHQRNLKIDHMYKDLYGEMFVQLFNNKNNKMKSSLSGTSKSMEYKDDQGEYKIEVKEVDGERKYFLYEDGIKIEEGEAIGPEDKIFKIVKNPDFWEYTTERKGLANYYSLNQQLLNNAFDVFEPYNYSMKDRIAFADKTISKVLSQLGLFQNGILTEEGGQVIDTAFKWMVGFNEGNTKQSMNMYIPGITEDNNILYALMAKWSPETLKAFKTKWVEIFHNEKSFEEKIKGYITNIKVERQIPTQKEKDRQRQEEIKDSYEREWDNLFIGRNSIFSGVGLPNVKGKTEQEIEQNLLRSIQKEAKATDQLRMDGILSKKYSDLLNAFATEDSNEIKKYIEDVQIIYDTAAQKAQDIQNQGLMSKDRIRALRNLLRDIRVLNKEYKKPVDILFPTKRFRFLTDMGRKAETALFPIQSDPDDLFHRQVFRALNLNDKWDNTFEGRRLREFFTINPAAAYKISLGIQSFNSAFSSFRSFGLMTLNFAKWKKLDLELKTAKADIQNQLSDIESFGVQNTLSAVLSDNKGDFEKAIASLKNQNVITQVHFRETVFKTAEMLARDNNFNCYVYNGNFMVEIKQKVKVIKEGREETKEEKIRFNTAQEGWFDKFLAVYNKVLLPTDASSMFTKDEQKAIIFSAIMLRKIFDVDLRKHIKRVRKFMEIVKSEMGNDIFYSREINALFEKYDNLNNLFKITYEKDGKQEELNFKMTPKVFLSDIVKSNYAEWKFKDKFIHLKRVFENPDKFKAEDVTEANYVFNELKTTEERITYIKTQLRNQIDHHTAGVPVYVPLFGNVSDNNLPNAINDFQSIQTHVFERLFDMVQNDVMTVYYYQSDSWAKKNNQPPSHMKLLDTWFEDLSNPVTLKKKRKKLDEIKKGDIVSFYYLQNEEWVFKGGEYQGKAGKNIVVKVQGVNKQFVGSKITTFKYEDPTKMVRIPETVFADNTGWFLSLVNKARQGQLTGSERLFYGVYIPLDLVKSTMINMTMFLWKSLGQYIMQRLGSTKSRMSWFGWCNTSTMPHITSMSEEEMQNFLKAIGTVSATNYDNMSFSVIGRDIIPFHMRASIVSSLPYFIELFKSSKQFKAYKELEKQVIKEIDIINRYIAEEKNNEIIKEYRKDINRLKDKLYVARNLGDSKFFTFENFKLDPKEDARFERMLNEFIESGNSTVKFQDIDLNDALAMYIKFCYRQLKNLGSGRWLALKPEAVNRVATATAAYNRAVITGVTNPEEIKAEMIQAIKNLEKFYEIGDRKLHTTKGLIKPILFALSHWSHSDNMNWKLTPNEFRNQMLEYGIKALNPFSKWITITTETDKVVDGKKIKGQKIKKVVAESSLHTLLRVALQDAILVNAQYYVSGFANLASPVAVPALLIIPWIVNYILAYLGDKEREESLVWKNFLRALSLMPSYCLGMGGGQVFSYMLGNYTSGEAFELDLGNKEKNIAAIQAIQFSNTRFMNTLFPDVDKFFVEAMKANDVAPEFIAFFEKTYKSSQEKIIGEKILTSNKDIYPYINSAVGELSRFKLTPNAYRFFNDNFDDPMYTGLTNAGLLFIPFSSDLKVPDQKSDRTKGIVKSLLENQTKELKTIDYYQNKDKGVNRKVFEKNDKDKK